MGQVPNWYHRGEASPSPAGFLTTLNICPHSDAIWGKDSTSVMSSGRVIPRGPRTQGFKYSLKQSCHVTGAAGAKCMGVANRQRQHRLAPATEGRTAEQDRAQCVTGENWGLKEKPKAEAQARLGIIISSATSKAWSDCNLQLRHDNSHVILDIAEPISPGVRDVRVGILNAPEGMESIPSRDPRRQDFSVPCHVR